MKTFFALLFVMILSMACCAALAESEHTVDQDTFFADLAAARKAYDQIEKDELEINDERRC